MKRFAIKLLEMVVPLIPVGVRKTVKGKKVVGVRKTVKGKKVKGKTASSHKDDKMKTI